MSALGVTRRGRRKAEALMLDACVVKPVTGNATDPATGVVTPAYGAPVYTGKCKLQRVKDVYPTTPMSGEHKWTVAPGALHLPVVGSGAVKVGQVVEITASVEPENVGRL